MKRAAMVLVVLLSATFAYGAGEEMKKLDFLIGDWKGEAWIQMGPGKRESLIQTEKVTSRAGGKVLLVEGVGRRKLENGTAGEVVHDAIAFMSWDKYRKVYRFDAHVAQQESVDTTINLTAPKTLVWGFDTPQGKIRYTIKLTPKGEWYEAGDWSADGKAWTKFFEMTLVKGK